MAQIIVSSLLHLAFPGCCLRVNTIVITSFQLIGNWGNIAGGLRRIFKTNIVSYLVNWKHATSNVLKIIIAT